MINVFNQGSSFSCEGDAGGLDRTAALSLIEHLNAKLHVSTIRLAPRHGGGGGEGPFDGFFLTRQRGKWRGGEMQESVNGSMEVIIWRLPFGRVAA